MRQALSPPQTKLEKIFSDKREEVDLRKLVRPIKGIIQRAVEQKPAIDFLKALGIDDSRSIIKQRLPALIAEIKRASPSAGRIAPDLDPINLARIYQENGASAISVLTDERYFEGSLDDLVRIAELSSGIPLLRKDFIFDPYQVYEARAAGADAVLLIVAGLSPLQLSELHSLALELGMTPLVEVHSLAELELALGCRPRLIGINNRNLHDFTVDLNTTHQLRPFVPVEVGVVAESGIRSRKQVEELSTLSIDAVLVGQALVSAPDIGAQVRLMAGIGEG